VITVPSKDRVPLLSGVFLHCACNSDLVDALYEWVRQGADPVYHCTLTAGVRIAAIVTEMKLVINTTPRTRLVPVIKRPKPQLQILDPGKALEERSRRVARNEAELPIHLYTEELDEIGICESKLDSCSRVVESHSRTKTSLDSRNENLGVEEPLPHNDPR
jgi:hypothetical protein